VHLERTQSAITQQMQRLEEQIGHPLFAKQGRQKRLTIDLEEPVFGVAPGQVACLMDGDLVLGHGVIAAR